MERNSSRTQVPATQSPPTQSYTPTPEERQAHLIEYLAGSLCRNWPVSDLEAALTLVEDSDQYLGIGLWCVAAYYPKEENIPLQKKKIDLLISRGASLAFKWTRNALERILYEDAKNIAVLLESTQYTDWKNAAYAPKKGVPQTVGRNLGSKYAAEVLAQYTITREWTLLEGVVSFGFEEIAEYLYAKGAPLSHDILVTSLSKGFTNLADKITNASSRYDSPKALYVALPYPTIFERMIARSPPVITLLAEAGPYPTSVEIILRYYRDLIKNPDALYKTWIKKNMSTVTWYGEDARNYLRSAAHLKRAFDIKV